jgi:ribosomal protein S12 methylthiotransferase accessory factor YcaO
VVPHRGGSAARRFARRFTRKFYNPDGEVTADMLVDLQSGNEERGIVALPFERPCPPPPSTSR